MSWGLAASQMGGVGAAVSQVVQRCGALIRVPVGGQMIGLALARRLPENSPISGRQRDGGMG